MICTHCEGVGLINTDQLDDEATTTLDAIGPEAFVERGMLPEGSDVAICDCCGDGETWYGTPGEHYDNGDPPGMEGPYAYNGGLCECN